MRKTQLFAFLLVMSVALVANSQINYLQEIYNGGITSDAYSQWTTNDPGTFDVYIEPGSTIRKAILFVQVISNPDDNIAYLNGQPIHLSGSETLNNPYFFYNSATFNYYYRTLAIDVTNLVSPTELNYTLTPPNQSPLLLEYGGYVEFYLMILYENISLPSISVNVMMNELDVDPFLNYHFEMLNKIDTIYNVALAVNAGQFCDTIQDGSIISINGVQIGLAGGNDDNSTASCAALTSSFYYQNGVLFGLGNNFANPTMNGSDGIAFIEDNLNSLTSVSVLFEYQSNFRPQTNPVHQLFLTYSTHCSPFPVTTPTDTTICQGATLQLNATGGTPNSHSATGYEWLPATGLSCSDCPNPIFTADSSMFYTVRIWNTDSCSVVRPLKINVRKTPLWDTVVLSPSVCGTSTGFATLFGLPNNGAAQSWTEVGGLTQNSNLFSNLGAGNHTFYFTDTNGCQSTDTIVFVPSTNPTVASFVANPLSGPAPLSVSFANTSLYATDFLWSVNGLNLGATLTNFVLDTSGTYYVHLVAWQNNSSCADTFALKIVVFDSLVLQIPNVFSPNSDGANDFYTLSSNVPVSGNYRIFNRWGETLAENTLNFGPGTTVLWDGISPNSIPSTEGTYFYQLEITPAFDNGVIGKTVMLSGFLQVVR